MNGHEWACASSDSASVIQVMNLSNGEVFMAIKSYCKHFNCG